MSLLAHLVFEHSAFVSNFRLQLFHSDTIWIIVTTFLFFILDLIPWILAWENIRFSSLFVAGAFRAEERLRLSDRNSILMT